MDKTESAETLSIEKGALDLEPPPKTLSPPLSGSNLALTRQNALDLESDVESLERVPTGPVYSIFTKNQKRYILSTVTVGVFFSPLSANIYSPVLNVLARDLHVSNGLINLTITSYMIFQALAPTIYSNLGDMAGRRPAYVAGFLIYIVANVGLALQNQYAALCVLRCLQSAGSSGTIALGIGVVGDIASSGERGKYMGWITQSRRKDFSADES